jgi:hypothetical protein
VRIPFGEEKQLVCNAQVVYSNPGKGVGVRFQGLNDDARALLADELSHD